MESDVATDPWAGTRSHSDSSVPETSRTERDSDAWISLSGLRKTYGESVVLDGIDLDVAAGEFLVLLGPSGCGKTTTMRSIVGLETPDAGSIKIAGRVVYDSVGKFRMPTQKRNVGMVFQSYAIWPNRTVAENVSFPLKMQKVKRPEAARRVADVLETVGLEGYERRPASDLSGGQMQRVALARSIAMRPDVLLLDEPLSNLDAKLRERLRVELKQLQQSLGMTAIYVTHDQSEALALADRIALMRAGRLEQVGSPIDLYHDPGTRFAAEFMGTNNVWERPSNATAPSRGRLDLGVLTLTVPDDQASPAVRTVCVRAEDVVLGPSTSQPEVNTWEATLDLVNLLGSQILYVARLDNGTPVQVLTPVTQQLFHRGDKVSIHIPPASVKCFREEQ